MLIALTGFGQPHDFAATKQAGFNHHMVKPADPDKPLAILQPPDIAKVP